ncbi:ABC transporter ATP-binding protein [Candidatus Omnitrophota bacterium]
MTIYSTDKTSDRCNKLIGKDKTIALNSIGKKYSFLRSGSGVVNNDNTEDFWALKDVSLDVYKREILGLIGRNGAGKTTLLNIITGVLTPSNGEIYKKGRTLGLFNLGVGFQDELTGKENIFLNGAIIGATRKELDNKISDIIDFSELGDFVNMPLGTYSQGMRLRLGFSIIANLDFEILVIDEVLTVGDSLFQNKCFERLMDFRRSGKTLVITTQNMSLIDRLCDKVVLLDHGCLLFSGEPAEGINRYRALLNREQFFVGPERRRVDLVKNTKKWADDIADWGKKIGTKEVMIESVYFINKFGWKSKTIRSGDSLKIEVHFTVRNNIKNPHFGIAVFRKDGVYCYGPNTKFDGYRISQIKEGQGHFILDYRKLLLAPGEYKVSVAIWDKNETMAFGYHNGCYKLIVKGYENIGEELVSIPCVINFKDSIKRFLPFLKRIQYRHLDLSLLERESKEMVKTKGIGKKDIKLLNYCDQAKDIFITNESVKIVIDFQNFKIETMNFYLWVAFYRDDNICCQKIVRPFNKNKRFQILFPKLSFLPGSYRISLGVWDNLEKKFSIYDPAACQFRMVFNRQDHGTVYLEHKWKWTLP